MAVSTYEGALSRLLAHEGGYNNHPSDPGGPTNFGITIHDYRQYVKRNATAADVKTMALDEAKRIYRAKYWDAQRCSDLPAGVDNAVFDYGVHSGIGRSGKVLRRCLDLPDNTSVVNDLVIAAAMQADAAKLVTAICDERLRFLQSLKTWGVFGKGWGRRVAEVETFSLSLAVGTPAARTIKTTKAARTTKRAATSTGKALVPAAKVAQRGSSGAIAAAGIAVAQQAHQSGSSATAVAAIVLATVVLAIGVWLLWHWRQQRRQGMPA